MTTAIDRATDHRVRAWPVVGFVADRAFRQVGGASDGIGLGVLDFSVRLERDVPWVESVIASPVDLFPEGVLAPVPGSQGAEESLVAR